MFRAEPFRFDRAWTFPLAAGELWGHLERVDEYPRWWGWLREFRSAGLEPGATSSFVVQSALPRPLRFDVELTAVEPARLVAGWVSGDLEGPATLTLAPHPGGCRARLAWQLQPDDVLLRALSKVSRPFMAWSHDQIVQLGVRQFRRRVLAERT